MTLENIIDSINVGIWSSRLKEDSLKSILTNLILHKKIVPSPTFKAYKTWEYTVWKVDGTNKKEFFSFKKTLRSVPDMKKEQTESTDKEFLNAFMEFLFNNIDSVIYGE